MYLALLASVAEMDTIPRSGASAIAEPADSPTATIAAPMANFVMVFLPAICFAQPTKPDEPFRPTFAFAQAKTFVATWITSIVGAIALKSRVGGVTGSAETIS